MCHGDYSAQRAAARLVTGDVDLGELAAPTEGGTWRSGDGAWLEYEGVFEPLVYEGIGITPDPARIGFFRLLYDLVS